VRQRVEQPRLRGLAGLPLVDRRRATRVPRRQFHGRIVSQPVDVVLRRVAQRQRVHPLPQQLDHLVANAIAPPRIEQLPGQMLDQPQPMIGLPQQQQAGVRRDALVGCANLHRTVKIRLEEPNPGFTHGVVSWGACQ